MQLRPCAGCNRHVALDEKACPFCGQSLAPVAATRDPLARLSRAAIFVAGAAAGVATTACWTSKSEPQHAQTQIETHVASPDAGATSQEESVAVTPDASPLKTNVAVTPDASPPKQTLPPDDGERHYQNHPCVSRGPGQPPVCAPYGAPPARRRIV